MDAQCSHLAGSLWPCVSLVSPSSHSPSFEHSYISDSPAAQCTATVTYDRPTAPVKEGLAAFTMASISSVVMSPFQREILALRGERSGEEPVAMELTLVLSGNR